MRNLRCSNRIPDRHPDRHPDRRRNDRHRSLPAATKPGRDLRPERLKIDRYGDDDWDYDRD